MKLYYHLITKTLKAKSSHMSVNSGFTMVETLVAGCIFLVVLVAVSRISILSITSGRNRVERDRIEAAIQNDIQMLQQADTKLSFDSIPTNEKKYACLNPANYLKEQLSQDSGVGSVQEPLMNGNKASFVINKHMKANNPRILVVIYSFLAPENSIKNEKRIFELNPNFYSECIL